MVELKARLVRYLACNSGDVFVELLLKDENLVLGRTGGDGVLLLIVLGFIHGETGGFRVLLLSLSIVLFCKHLHKFIWYSVIIVQSLALLVTCRRTVQVLP